MPSAYSGQRLRTSFYSNGKLLLTGEYAVLDGALALAVPTQYGQSLTVTEIPERELQWKSRDENGNIWFQASFDLSHFDHAPEAPSFFSADGAMHQVESDPDSETGGNAHEKSPEIQTIYQTLAKIIREAKKLNPRFLRGLKGYAVATQMTFPRDWGLGSSSTLINNVAQWAEVDAYRLLWNAFSGSGYDIACARNDHPILYKVHKGEPKVEVVNFHPIFNDRLYFIHLNKKQNSREGIATYRKRQFDKTELIDRVSEITKKTVRCTRLSDFESLIGEHEKILSRSLQIPTVKQSLFPDFNGAIKSLGAWGGDFILVTGGADTPSYFKQMGYDTAVPYSEMVLANKRS
ncbi:GYDIA family GHMP kinase [Pricia sp. S334]|uniref:GYDIA family GHMP kinase n=1 Tax=Pricia mediterranea TaxID=3076079 RepID=A0ABU3L6E9_9FLAO|nr:GYDIA family GHMP kinase [Pricia sp. S334]MDT7829252.1 GYDIA family GHMP kinase [Pricia sp. S334]